jgi:hypothetical protein
MEPWTVKPMGEAYSKGFHGAPIDNPIRLEYAAS